MSHESVGIVCPNCGAFNRAFVVHVPFTPLDVHRAAESRDAPAQCANCGESLGGCSLVTESEHEGTAGAP